MFNNETSCLKCNCYTFFERNLQYIDANAMISYNITFDDKCH